MTMWRQPNKTMSKKQDPRWCPCLASPSTWARVWSILKSCTRTRSLWIPRLRFLLVSRKRIQRLCLQTTTNTNRKQRAVLPPRRASPALSSSKWWTTHRSSTDSTEIASTRPPISKLLKKEAKQAIIKHQTKRKKIDRRHRRNRQLPANLHRPPRRKAELNWKADRSQWAQSNRRKAALRANQTQNLPKCNYSSSNTFKTRPWCSTSKRPAIRFSIRD